MKKNYLFLFILFINSASILSQINPKNIDIVRDNYGVPHIYGKTDADVAYGLAWAHSEDDFKTIQEGYLAGNGLLSKYIGIKGAGADLITQVIESKETVDRLYNTLSPEFIKILEAYCEGINKYAKTYPEKILVKKLFPITPKKMARYSFLQLFIANGADKLVRNIFENKVNSDFVFENNMNGSNAIALNSNKIGKKETFLAINPHQPFDGPTSWYEAHLISEEGTNIIGATFAGAPCILIGVNKNLAWTHTVNLPDKADIFKLQMHSRKKNIYIIDGQEFKLEIKKAKAYINILGVSIKIRRKFYKSLYGPTLKNDTGYYSVRTPSLYNIKSLEQWWKMNKAKSFSEFYNILKTRNLPGYNIGYADKNDTIFYISNGIIPKRNENYNWKKVVPGNTKKTLWNEYYKVEELPQVLNPKSGFVYNANHSPFKSTEKSENPKAENFSKTMGYELYDNNRSTRLLELIESYEKIDYETFKKIKNDRTFPTPMNYNYVDINNVFKMNPENYSEVSELLKSIQNWDRKADADSFGAGTFGMMYYNLSKNYKKAVKGKLVSKEILYECLKNVKIDMIKNFGTTKIKLGDFQKLVRGNKEIPIFGLPDVITAMRGVKHENGKIKISHGESYVGLVRFTENGPEYESVSPYGTSDDPKSPHYNDQMELLSSFKTKKMTFDKDEIYSKSKRIYNPL
ncbi:MAG: penicillin amidase [Flavobacteriaceae bacterium]|nr:penicillin amidase [Flavobacteriaceae bacterium]